MARRKDDPLKDATAFCKFHLGKDCFAPFTGQDYSAWKAFVYLVEKYKIVAGSDLHERPPMGGPALVITAQSTLAALDAWLAERHLRLNVQWDRIRGQVEAVLRAGDISPTAKAWGFGQTVAAAVLDAIDNYNLHERR